jgi:hypothetical protein
LFGYDFLDPSPLSALSPLQDLRLTFGPLNGTGTIGSMTQLRVLHLSKAHLTEVASRGVDGGPGTVAAAVAGRL